MNPNLTTMRVYVLNSSESIKYDLYNNNESISSLGEYKF